MKNINSQKGFLQIPIKRIFIIHGWDGSPQNRWFPWLEKELKKKGFTVKELFEKNLGVKTLVEHNKGHFSDDAGIKELPSVLEVLCKMIKRQVLK